jgi:hypothetical protein
VLTTKDRHVCQSKTVMSGVCDDTCVGLPSQISLDSIRSFLSKSGEAHELENHANQKSTHRTGSRSRYFGGVTSVYFARSASCL